MVTILDVARAAGVSKSTVSRVLDERLPRSTNATAERVREVAAELGYVRDPLASGLRRSGTSTVGVIVPRLTDTVMAMLYEAITEAAAGRDLFTVVATTEDLPEAQDKAVESLRRRRVDGLILTTARVGEPVDVGGPPYALALRTDGAGPAAIGDDRLGAQLATRHLIDLGHRRIGLVGGPEYASSARGRAEGYREALASGGIGFDPAMVAGDAFSIEAGEIAGRALLDRPDRPSAVFAVNDNTAIGVLAAAHALGLEVPRDVSIVGYNDIPVVSRLPVPLTTVRVPFRQIAADALSLVLDDGAARGETAVSAPTLIPRASTAPPG
ncbi:LacI family DNA-binding transcriptional regulator [Prauserella rugosa]|uniref:LacI family transcriptional regulator n=1 Tax=Prauserella rugosa TaxID=43354 RepID=A0A660C6S3_9PSEU|nr:LacI family DNA-binding transcriptional regulator [Prauserella rugosa]KID27775.1 transcriptional regulator, LacI family [Prauserella sp. Am3]TWH19300.1 LacI family transcriptional regulator [Prauserella rugosa]